MAEAWFCYLAMLPGPGYATRTWLCYQDLAMLPGSIPIGCDRAMEIMAHSFPAWLIAAESTRVCLKTAAHIPCSKLT